MTIDPGSSSTAEVSANRKLIMVCGAARSGTTMLDLMLGNADDALSTGEIYALFRPFRVHHWNPVCSCGEVNCAAWRGLLDVPERDFHANILRTRPDINYVVDSSKDLRWVLDSNVWANDAGIPVENVVLWKNPIELSYSYWRRGESVSHYRDEFVKYYGRLLNLKLPFVAVNYKQLAIDTEATLELLCNRLGIGYTVSRVNFWEKRHHHFFGSAGTRRQVGKQGSSIQYNEDYPDEFNALFTQELAWMDKDENFLEIVAELKARDVSREAVISDIEYLSKPRPVWYFRHALKAFFRKRFPERSLVVE